MAKVYLTDHQVLCARLSRWVYGEMKVRNITLQKLSEKRGISHQALSRKLKTSSFDYIDFLFFVKEFEPSEKELKELTQV